jgi:hypothetical protein
MKKCSYCGQEYPDDVTICAKDGAEVVRVSTRQTATAPPAPAPSLDPKTGRYRKYEDVPWYRREPGTLAFIGVLFCNPITIALCLICLTGDVYRNGYDKDGNLKVWGVGNKIAAILILALQVFILWLWNQPK